MNFLDAHKILHSHIDVVAKGQRSDFPIRRVSELKNSKEEIFDAYKLFIAHMLAFNTRTQQEYELLDIQIMTLNHFVEDSLADAIEECRKIVEDKSFFGRLKNKATIPIVEKRLKVLLKEHAEHISNFYKSEEKDAYINAIFAEAKKYRERISAIPTGTNETLSSYLKTINEYCVKVYETANIQMEETDVEYFYPFSLLKEFTKNPNLVDLFEQYKDYIWSNQ